MTLYSTKFFVSINGNDANTGFSWYEPCLTLNHMILTATTTAEIYIGNGAFAETVDITSATAINLVVIGTDKTNLTINSWIGNDNVKILFKNMNVVINGLDGGNRSVMFDNCNVTIDGGCDNYPIFYHCDVQINNPVLRSIFISSNVTFADEAYWYLRQEFLFYYCKYYSPTGFDKKRTQVFTPLCDKTHFESVMQDILDITKELA